MAGGTLKTAKRLAKFLMGELPVWRAEVQVPTVYLGSDYGGWAVIPRLLSADSIVYSFGIGHDASFDLEMMQRFGCPIHAYDPTPGLAMWVKEQNYPESFHFHPVGLAHFDGDVELRSQSVSEATSGTILGSQELDVPTSGIPIPVRRLQTILQQNGHATIDLLKMDIEGAEFDVVDDLLAGSVRPTQLLIEFHRYFKSGKTREREAIKRLGDAGYVLFDLSLRNMEFGFVLRSSLEGLG